MYSIHNSANLYKNIKFTNLKKRKLFLCFRKLFLCFFRIFLRKKIKGERINFHPHSYSKIKLILKLLLLCKQSCYSLLLQGNSLFVSLKG